MANYKQINLPQMRDSHVLAGKIINALTGNTSIHAPSGSTIGGTAIKFFNIVRDDKAALNPTGWNVVLESVPAVDAFQNTETGQSYRIYVAMVMNAQQEVTDMTMYFGSYEQIKEDQNGGYTYTSDCPSVKIWSSTNYPTMYKEFQVKMALTDRGFALTSCPTVNINGALNNNSSGNCFLCAQRPVNPSTGIPSTEGNAPIFLLFKSSTSSLSEFSIAVIREKLIKSSKPATSTGVPSPTSGSIYKWTMDWPHPNLFDDYSHIIKFPYGFKSSSSLYMEELDLICFVNATAFAGDQDVTITMYGESANRVYNTDWGLVQYGQLRLDTATADIPRIISGARIGILTQGGGF